MNIMQSLSLTFSMNDMRIKIVQFSISTLQFRSKMQSFIKCTKLTIRFQKTKMPSNVKCLFFCIFNILKKKMHGLISNLIYKIILYIKEITQAEHQEVKQTTQSTRTTPKNEKQRERLRPKIQLQTGFLSSQRISAGTT
jgi:uncharacterized protein YdhG (YjbR/CyaY superfamily)